MHDQSATETISALTTDGETGLTIIEAKNRLLNVGPNALEQGKSTSIFTLLMRQFKSPIVFLLLASAILSFSHASWSDGIAILIVLLINTCIGFFMEHKAERSMDALRGLTKTFSKVIRSGSLIEINTSDIVPGDLIYLEAGDIIPADARIINAYQLQVDESALTGESIPAEKNNKELPLDTPLADRTNLLHKGTAVTRGNAKAVVIATGMNTELGKIASLVQHSEDVTTPLEKKLSQFSKKLIWITLLIAAAIFLTGIVNDKSFVQMLNTVIALSVAAIPEGLPIVATLALAHGMIKMAKRNVIVKKLASVETLGGTNIICTDKTGTLTYNKISVSHIITPDFNSKLNTTDTTSFRLTLQAMTLCNNANINDGQNNAGDVGDPLEVGLLHFATNRGLDPTVIKSTLPRVSEEPFSSETKVMGTHHVTTDGSVTFTKGAAESIISLCTHYRDGETSKEFSKIEKEKWLAVSEAEASNGLKVIAFAHKASKSKETAITLSDLTFLGIASLIDPPREDVADAIHLCHKAGIRVIMITGDHPATARNIASQIGIEHGDVMQGASMPSREIYTKEDKTKWRATSIFARVSPAQKLDLIEVLQEDQSIVAMTGDGVNDAPALKKADIGIAMGMRGTDVAKEVADMVLKDDSFSSIVTAIKEGRVILENIRKFLMFLLSSNLSEILVIATLFITNSPLTITPLQILFINLLSDVFPALALGFNTGSDAIMHRPPHDPKKPVLSNLQWMSVIIYAIIIAASTFSSTIYMADDHEHSSASTILFYTLILCQLLHVFNVGNHRQAFFKSDIAKNSYVWAALAISILLGVLAYIIPPFKDALRLGNLNGTHLLIIFGCALQSFVIIQVFKKLNVIH
ncbi:cation-translocating P-type ATPase [Pseudochryseolinea flava]|uniref:P-type Cu(+) transporter n=1 Tax=Pseudochryseolinea flava TaxID=2059302 RepID=A0A364XW30_9BACT|nr:cation-translocating P-type ATPase [Pseudochryseolinea flava]RAV98153.1 hypothetical protein DQQ10_25135 [Pseudochryseolinea flava]